MKKGKFDVDCPKCNSIATMYFVHGDKGELIPKYECRNCGTKYDSNLNECI